MLKIPDNEVLSSTIDIINRECGCGLHVGVFSRARLIAEERKRNYRCWIVGPMFDPTNYDARIFATWRELDGRITVITMVQDVDDDVFLSPRAEGTERWKPGQILYVTP